MSVVEGRVPHPTIYVHLAAMRVVSGHGRRWRDRPFEVGGCRLRHLREPMDFFWVRSCLYVKSDSVHICTETFFIFQEILRAKSDFGASMQFDRRPMALPYLYGRRLEGDLRRYHACMGANWKTNWVVGSLLFPCLSR
jgi:hypothetical protein